MNKHYVVIVLGLGDYRSVYTWLTRDWEKKYNVIPVIHVVGWGEKKRDLEKRLPLLVDKIKNLLDSGAKVSLVGISAGVSFSLNAYTELQKQRYQLNGSVVFLCGRFNFNCNFWYPLSVGVQSHPAFEQSVAQVQENLKKMSLEERKKLYVFRSIFDEVVPSSATLIKGANNFVYPMPLHFFCIMAIFLFSKKFITLLSKN